MNKPTLKKASGIDNKKKEIEEMQKMVNNIKIQNKDENEKEEKKDEEKNEDEHKEEENKEEEIKEEEKEEIKIETPPPTLLTCQQNGIIEKNILQFLTKSEQISLFSCNKTFALLALGILKDKLSIYKNICDVYIGQTMDDKINSLEVKFSQEDLNAPIKPFEISRGCAKAVGLLDEELYLRVFLRPVQEKTLEDIIIVYKLFCFKFFSSFFVFFKSEFNISFSTF